MLLYPVPVTKISAPAVISCPSVCLSVSLSSPDTVPPALSAAAGAPRRHCLSCPAKIVTQKHGHPQALSAISNWILIHVVNYRSAPPVQPTPVGTSWCRLSEDT
jgi:hypothetical protein